MTKAQLVRSIVRSLDDEGALDILNYDNAKQQAEDVERVIANILADYMIIKGNIVD